MELLDGLEPFHCQKKKSSGHKINQSVQSLSCVQLCDPMDCSMSGFPVHHQLPEITQTHFHWVSDASWTLLKRIRQWHRELVWEAHSISEEKKQHKVIYVSMFGRFKNWIKYLIGCNSSVHGILQASILEWVAISFFRGSSQPTDWTGVSCIAGRFFTIWATKEAQEKKST